MTLVWITDKEVSHCICVGPAQHHHYCSQPRVGHGGWRGSWQDSGLGPYIWDAEASRAALGGWWLWDDIVTPGLSFGHLVFL